MSIPGSLFGKKDGKVAADATRATQGIPQLAPACGSVPFYASLDVSPDETLVCCAAPDGNVHVYESGTQHPKWSLPVPSTRECICRFVGPERLLVLSQKPREQPLIALIQLVNTADGSVKAETMGPGSGSRGDADHRAGLFVYDGFFDVVIVQTGGDEIKISTLKSGQVDLPGPKIGRDGKCYFILTVGGRLHRIDGNEMTPIMPGRNCIHFEAPAMVYCGGGYVDRSGASALNMTDLEAGVTSAISWGMEPVSEIAPAGRDHLLIASETDIWGRYASSVTMFSVANRSKEWSLTISDLPRMRPVILTSVPEEGWALIQTGKLLKLIALEDGRAIRVLPKKSQHFATAEWLASKKLLYIAGNPSDLPGTLECYRI